MVVSDDLISYIFKFYDSYLTENEFEAWEFLILKKKIKAHLFYNPNEEQRIRKKTDSMNKDSIKLLKDGEHQFYKDVIERILREKSEDVIINICPICGVLRRTPWTNQCRNGHKIDN